MMEADSGWDGNVEGAAEVHSLHASVHLVPPQLEDALIGLGTSAILLQGS